MNKEDDDHNLSISKIILKVRMRDIALIAIIAGSLGYIMGALLPHLFFLEHINVALGVFVLFGMLFLVGFILLFFEPILFPYRSNSWTLYEQNNVPDTADNNENPAREESAQMPTKSAEDPCASREKNTASDISAIQNEEIAKLGLTEREDTVTHLLLQGYKNKEIAAQMYLSESAIKYHVRNIYKKARVNSRYELRKLIWCNIDSNKTPEVIDQTRTSPTTPQ